MRNPFGSRSRVKGCQLVWISYTEVMLHLSAKMTFEQRYKGCEKSAHPRTKIQEAGGESCWCVQGTPKRPARGRAESDQRGEQEGQRDQIPEGLKHCKQNADSVLSKTAAIGGF